MSSDKRAKDPGQGHQAGCTCDFSWFPQALLLSSRQPAILLMRSQESGTQTGSKHATVSSGSNDSGNRDQTAPEAKH